MKLIIMNGSSCSGKSTVVNYILQEKENYFHLSYDKIKWSLSKFVPHSKSSEDVFEILFAFADTLFKMKYNVICDSIIYQRSRTKLINVAIENKCEIVEINLEAEWGVLLKRFNERVVSVMANTGKISANTSKERFKELFDIFQNEKNTSGITLRTDTQSIEEVSEEVMKYL